LSETRLAATKTRGYISIYNWIYQAPEQGHVSPANDVNVPTSTKQ
jgi:hypothetical protein